MTGSGDNVTIACQYIVAVHNAKIVLYARPYYTALIDI